MAPSTRISACLALAAILAQAPLAAGNLPGKHASGNESAPTVAAPAKAKASAGISRTQGALLALMAFLGMALGTGAEPQAPAGPQGLVPSAGPDLPSLDRYMDICPTYVHDAFFDQPSHCAADPDPAKPLSGKEAMDAAEAMETTWVVEERILSVNKRALDLADCVCRAYRLHAKSKGTEAERDQLLFDRLLATRTQRAALSTAIGELRQVLSKVWDRLHKEPTLWHIPDEFEPEAEGAPEVPWPEREARLRELIATLEKAKNAYDTTVQPRHRLLRQKLKQLAKALEAREAYDASVIPELVALRARLRKS